MSEKVDKILTGVFLVLAAISVALYFLKADRTLFIYVAGIAIAIRLAQYFIRYNFRRK